MIMPTYFFLIILLPAWLDRWSRPTASNGSGGRRPDTR
jgi:hypothetical protein